MRGRKWAFCECELPVRIRSICAISHSHPNPPIPVSLCSSRRVGLGWVEMGRVRVAQGEWSAPGGTLRPTRSTSRWLDSRWWSASYSLPHPSSLPPGITSHTSFAGVPTCTVRALYLQSTLDTVTLQSTFDTVTLHSTFDTLYLNLSPSSHPYFRNYLYIFFSPIPSFFSNIFLACVWGKQRERPGPGSAEFS